ncbi:MAG TPA: hypothetical protein VIV57_24465 [Anaeromyxobacter sp.]
MTRCLAAMLLVSAGCASLVDSRSFVNPQADFTVYKKVGLLPFRNQAEDRLAGEKVTEHFMTELLIAGEHDVMDPGQFNAIVGQVTKSNAPVSAAELSPTHLGQIATVAGIQGIFMGTVHEYRMIPLGGEQYPVISMTVKFVDAPTGTVAWQHSINITGGPYLPIVSVGETFTLGELTQKACRAVVKDFYRKATSK